MMGVIQTLLAMGINMNENIQESNNILFGRLEGSRITTRGFWACFSNKNKKGEKFL
jgi:hypothetical protein